MSVWCPNRLPCFTVLSTLNADFEFIISEESGFANKVVKTPEKEFEENPVQEVCLKLFYEAWFLPFKFL